MNFENPVWLYLTPLIVLFIAGLVTFGLRRREALLSQFAAARLLDQLTEKASLKRSLMKAGLIILACALIGVALARPQYGVDFIERKSRGLDIVFVLDSSRSMLATDLRPTRLERAKLAIMDLVERLESDRIGLVVFAGNAFLQTPPTLDYSAFRENLNAISPSSLSRGGSNIGQALREAVKAFPRDDNHKVVILLTDGEDLEEQAINTAREIAKDGIRVYSIGIGTPEGTYLKMRSEDGAEEFVRDPGGQPVRSQLDETTLQKISQLTGGSYSRLAGQSLELLYTSVLATLPREERESEFQESRIERYQWALLAAVICLVVEILIRRRQKTSTHIIAILLCLNLITPVDSFADETDPALPDPSTEEAATENPSTDPRVIYNRAHASLLEGNYAEARELYEKAIEYSDDIALERDGLYNMAHAMNQMGEEALQKQDLETAADYWKQAAELFKSANELDPTDTASLEDAQLMADRHKALEEFLKEQQSQEQQQDDKSNQDKQDSEAETDENESSEREQSPDEESSETNDSQSDSKQEQSSENASEQEQSEKQESDSSGESSNAEDNAGNESDQSGDTMESSEDADPGETDSDPSAESTGNPAEDMQQQDEEAVSNEAEEDTSETKESEGMPQTSTETDGSAGKQGTATIIEGMDISEAQLLLDSLRNDEQLLPFTGPSEKQGQRKETRDW